MRGEVDGVAEDLLLLLGRDLGVGAGEKRKARGDEEDDFAPRQVGGESDELMDGLDADLEAINGAPVGTAGDLAKSNLAVLEIVAKLHSVGGEKILHLSAVIGEDRDCSGMGQDAFLFFEKFIRTDAHLGQ